MGPVILASAAIAAPEPPRPKDAAEAAKQFEALLIAQMMKHAHESAAGSLGEEGDATEETMWDIAAQQFSQLLAERGGLGLAKMIASGLAVADSAFPRPVGPASVPSADAKLTVPLGSRATAHRSDSP